MSSFFEISTFVWEMLKVAYALTICVILLMVILENRSPLKTITWIVVLILLPGFGVLFYIFFGQRVRRTRIRMRKRLKNDSNLKQISKANIDSSITDVSADTSAIHTKTIQLLLKNSLAVLTYNNKVDLIYNGASMIDQIIAELKRAKSFIHIEYYVFANDEIGQRVANVLKQKAAEGVEVRMLVDDVGSWELPKSFFSDMSAAGIQIDSYLPVRFPKFTSHVNYRNHRKIVIVDGSVGFMGGMNIAKRYVDGGANYNYWCDMHLRIEGNAINFMQAIFISDWYIVKQKELTSPKYFPRRVPCGNATMQIAASGPNSQWPAIMMGMYSVISQACKFLYVTTPYFMPGDTILMALKVAAMGGVDVRIVIPQKSDSWLADRCSKSYIKELIDANVKVYLYKKGFLHGKTIVADGNVSVIGSANMDFRSFEQNFEMSAFIYNESISAQLSRNFSEYFSDSELVTHKNWKRRPFMSRLSESFARILSPIL